MSKKGDHDEIKLDKVTKEELDKIREIHLVSQNQHKQINNHLNNSIVRVREDFPQTESKTIGEYTGYLSKVKGTQDLHMVKAFLKDTRTIDGNTKEEGKQILLEQQTAVQEFLSASLYELLIYNRAPREGLIVDNYDQDKLYIRSKFLDNAQTLSAYLGYSED